jgi:hypothetical protein
MSGSFLLDDDKHAHLAPPRSQPPDLSGFHVLYTRTRASPYATYVASIRCVILRAPRSSGPFLLVLLSAAPCPCQSVTQSFTEGLPS